MANPLKRFEPQEPPKSYRTDQDWRALAQQWNFEHKWVKGRRWHYVQPEKDDEAARIVIVDGLVADEVWKVLEGQRLDYKDWPHSRLKGLEDHCRWMISRGTLSQDEMERAA